MNPKQKYRKDIKTAVQQIQQIIPVVNTSLNNVEGKLITIQSVIKKIDEASRHLSACIKAVKFLNQGATTLSLIPIIKVFITTLPQVLKTVETSLDTVQKTLNEESTSKKAGLGHRGVPKQHTNIY
ncbi:hypothetical protein [uncultured Bacteroides sp.]|uniref:hypothetical protein n=2 Tax=uncultured Bacteroides sp. TaxID=162156 RepID=UPI002609229A|nr:hypothetical protein [uncultured Bacteroides sp.]